MTQAMQAFLDSEFEPFFDTDTGDTLNSRVALIADGFDPDLQF